MKAPLWQSTWHGISLLEVAQSKNIEIKDLKKEDFYEIFYKKLKENNFNLDNTWVEKKQELTKMMRHYYEQIKNQTSNIKALSIGAGLGIVEMPLLKEGANIDLQEIQSSSFDYLKDRGVAFNEIITPSLETIPNASYDLLFSFTISYALDDSQYESYLKQCYRLLKPGGKLVLFDPELVLTQSYLFIWIRKLIKTIVFRHNNNNGIFWGWLRSHTLHKNLASKANFKCIEEFSMDSSFKNKYKKPFLGLLLKNSHKAYQWFVFKKP